MRQAGEHTPPLWLEQACAAPDPRGQTYVHHAMANAMLPYLSLACNSLHRDHLSGWQGVWAACQHCRGRSLFVAVVWSMLRITSSVRIRRALQAACRTPLRLSMALLHMSRPYPPTQCSVADKWWTPPLSTDVAYLLASHPRTYWRNASYLLASHPRTCWRNASYLLASHPRTCWRNTSYLLARKYCLTFCS